MIAKRSFQTANQSVHAIDCGITEILMPYGEDLSMLLPMLASLSQRSTEKWFTWIVSKSFSRNNLKSYDFAANNVRLIECEHSDDRLRMFWQALSYGNSGYVVAFLDELPEADRNRLEDASHAGQTRGMILRNRQQAKTG